MTRIIVILILIVVITFLSVRLRGICRLNGEIIDLLVDYEKKHGNFNNLPKEQLFTSWTKLIFSFKPLKMKYWLSKETINKLKT